MLRVLCAALILVGMNVSGVAAEEEGLIYELRIYTCEPGKLEALNTRFRDHTLRMFEKHGMKSVGYWTPSEGPGAENTLIYLLEHSSREAAEKDWSEFRADPEWLEIAANSELAHGKILAKAPDSIYLKKTDYSPVIGPPPAGRIFELRTYHATHGKLDQLNARFRDHTLGLFEKHGMKSYGYWVPADPPKSATTLIYLLDYPSREAAKESWAAFRADEDWQKVLAESQKEGSLTSAKPESLFLNLVDYSPVQDESKQ